MLTGLHSGTIAASNPLFCCKTKSVCRSSHLGKTSRESLLSHHSSGTPEVGTESLAVPSAVSRGALDVSRQIAIDLARQRVATETARTRNQQERIDRAFHAINEFEKGHVSITPIHNLKRNTSTASHQDSNELDKIGVAARAASHQSLDSLQNGAVQGSTDSPSTGKRARRLSNLGMNNSASASASSLVLPPQGIHGIAVADFPSGNELDAVNGAASDDLAIQITRKMVVDSLKGITFVNQYIIVGTLGQGAFGKVKLVLNSQDMNLYAVKLLSKGSLMRHQRMRPRSANDFQAEAQRRMNVIRLLHHPNIICPFEVIDDPQADKLLLVMEYAEAGPIMRGDHSINKIPLAEGVALKFFRDVLQGLDYLHSKNIVHGDLKPDNMLLASDGRVKISDFGSARTIEHGHTTVRTMGTPAFLAPEMCAGDPYLGEVADIWALGICLYMFIYGTVPFKHSSIMGLYNVIRSQPVSFPSKPAVSPALKDIIAKMLCKDPARRISLPAVMQHPWTTHGNNLPLLCRQAGDESDGQAESAKRPIADCLEGLVQMLSPLFIQRAYPAGSFLVKQGDPADSVFFIEDGQCQVGYNQRRTADEDLVSMGSNDSSDDEGPRQCHSPSSFGDTDDAGITDPGITEAYRTEFSNYSDGLVSRKSLREEGDAMISRRMSMGSTAFWDPPDLQHPANSAKQLETVDSNAEEALPSDSSTQQQSSTNERSLSHNESGSSSNGHLSPRARKTAKVRKRHLGMLQTMLEASRRAAEFVTSFSKSRSIIALRGPGQFIGEVLLFDNTGRDSPLGSWQTCVRARTDVHALILTVKDLKELVTRKPAAEVELRAAMAQRKSELLRLQTLERIAGFQLRLEQQLRVMLENPDITSVHHS